MERLTYNTRQLEELDKFGHLLDQVGAWEDKADGGYSYSYTWQATTGETGKETVFDINDHLLGIMNRMAYYMYLAFTRESGEMQYAAEQILIAREEAKSTERDQELEIMDEIWRVSK